MRRIAALRYVKALDWSLVQICKGFPRLSDMIFTFSYLFVHRFFFQTLDSLKVEIMLCIFWSMSWLRFRNWVPKIGNYEIFGHYFTRETSI